TAAPDGGSTFTGWSGDGCSGTGACNLTMTANTSVSAGFATPVLSAPVLKWQYGGCLAGPWCDTGWYASPAVADLDGDGQPDVIWGGYDAVALRGDNGSLKWRGASNNRIWPGIAIADLTGDGTPEVIVGRSSNELTVYNRSGSVVWTRNPFGTGNEVRSLAVADLDGDGQLEIIAGRAGNGATRQLSVFEPNGTVRPGWPARHDGDPGYGAGMYNENIAVADMNGDGFKEIFGPTASPYITALDRSGNQLPTSSIYNGFSPVGPKVWSQVGVNVDQAADLRGYANCGVENRPEFSYSAPVIADVDGDGVPELIVVGNVYDCNSGTELYHIPFILKLDRTRWSGSGFDWTVIPTPSPGSAPLAEDYSVIEDVVPSPAVADLDGDGRKEIIYPSYDGRVHAFWLDKTEHGSWPYTIPTRGAPGDDFRFASEPVVADLDNDGHAEVIFTSWPKKGTGGVGQLHVLDYLGVELYRVDLPDADLNGGENGGLGAPTLANIDSDPDLEVVVGTIAGGVAAYDLPNTANARILWGTGRGSYRRTGTAGPP
ncbi:MAG TPA: FG-GAP-like repeat-containing protein, partial [Vicinamibacteria bacterium]